MAARLSIANPNPCKLPGPQLLHQLVPSAGRDDASAIDHTREDGKTVSLSYHDFHRRSDALARRIISAFERSATTNPRMIVPILIPQCPDLYIAQLATLKAGGAFCPIVLDAPEDRLRFILGDVDSRILLTTTARRSTLPTLEGVEVIEADSPISDNEIDRPLEPRSINPTDPAYVMYTSGSTGQPKGVVLSHSAATQALLAHDRHIPTFLRFLQFASPTFDVSVFEIFFPWLRGRTLVSCDRRRLLNDLPAAINVLNIDACELTPSVASSLLRGRASVPGLRVLLTIGEMLKPAVVQEFGGDDSQPAILHGMYGPTEATIHCTLHTSFPKDMSCGSIGIPLDTVSAFVVTATESRDDESSPSLEILELGEEGELAVGGHQLADGYLNREKQTAAAFVRHAEFGMLYRTGDRARMLSDGTFECLGRISSGQVKLRGQRIELGEIEHAASRAAGCRDVVAEVIEGILVIFCVAADVDVSEDQIRATCQKWLPEFMVPGDIVLLDALPYLPSGKCDRKALRYQYEQRQQPADSTNNLQMKNMEKVLTSLKLTLRRDISPTSSLPALGLDSLTSIRVAAALGRQGLPLLDASNILAARTPMDICNIIEDLEQSTLSFNGHSTGDHLYRKDLDTLLSECVSREMLSGVETSFPCTPIQIAMLTETNKDPQSYCNWVELDFPGCLDLSQLTRAFEKLSKLHPLLRSGFVALRGSTWAYAQVVWDALDSDQIRQVQSFAYDFRIEDPFGLLRPLHVQLLCESGGSRMLLSLHHALFDQWAIDVLQHDLAEILEDKDCRVSTSFKAVSDYHLLHQEEANGADSLDFWQDHLRDATPTTLPLLRGQIVPRCLQRTAWHETRLKTAYVKSMVSQYACSAPAVFQTAVAFLLGSYTGTTDVIFGSVYSGRTIPVQGIESVFGPCLKTLPFRIEYASATTCRDLLVAVTDRSRLMQQHMLTSPTSIRQAAGVAPGVTLFDTLFVWQETALDSTPDHQRVRLVDSQDQLEFNLVLEFEPSDTNIRIRALYESSLVQSEQASLLLRQIESVVEMIYENPDSPLTEIGTNLSSEMLSISNPEPLNYADLLEISSSVEEMATRNPSATAILFAKSLDGREASTLTISYAELDARANQMANTFIASGLSPGDIVCICMEKCIDLYVAMLGSFKAGAGYLPLVPDTPPTRINSVLAQANIKLCICDSSTADVFHDLTKAKVIDVSQTDFSRTERKPPSTEEDGSRVAYAVFTSGSTGEPKGVPVTMDNLKSNIGALGELYKVSSGDRLLQSCSQAFDVSVFEIFFSLCNGMCLCSATKDVLFRDFEHSIRWFGVTHLSLTPTVASLVDPRNVPSVRFLVTAGEGITEKVHRTWAGQGLHQGYGPSETTNICSVKMNLNTNDVLSNIGPPLRNTSAFVMSPEEEEVHILPAGSYGEFVFGGEQVFHGYIGRDDLNSAKIIAHPSYGRLYRSGDMGRILPDGTMLVAGRLDDQVKIRGNRVELGEINAVVSDHPRVSDCTTLVFGETSADQMLATFWVPVSTESRPDSLPSLAESGMALVAELYEKLDDALPAYMIPSMLIPLTKLPMTVQGKLDKRILRQRVDELDNNAKDKLSRSHAASTADEPSSPEEQLMAKTLGDLLDIPTTNISRNASFFALGLNSLNAIQFARTIGDCLDVQLGVNSIMKNSSIARLNHFVSSLSSPNQDNDTTDIRKIFFDEFVADVKVSFFQQGYTVNDIFPCTPLQQAMLSASSSKGSNAYCNTTKLNMGGDMKKLQRCWYEMTRRHAILRTSFVETPIAAHPYAQVVLHDPPLPWFSGKTQNRTNSHLNGNANSHSQKQYQANGSGQNTPGVQPVTPREPLRIDVRGDDIYLQMHHAIYDGISVANLVQEIECYYQDVELPPAVSFEPFLEEVVSQNGQKAIDFWTTRMRGFRPHPLPSHEENVNEAEDVFHYRISVSPARLSAFSERHACTSLAVLQAAWVKTLASAQNVMDVCFGNVVSGRSVPVPNIDRLVAPCFNTIPLRTKLDSIRTNLDLVRELHRTNVDCLSYQLTAPRRIQGFSEDPSKHLFDSVLLLQPPQAEAAHRFAEEESMDMEIPLMMELIPEGDCYDVQMHYLPENIPKNVVALLADAFSASVSSCVSYPSSPVDHFLDFDPYAIAGILAPQQDLATNDGSSPTSQSGGAWTQDETSVREAFAELAGLESARISKQTSLYQIGLDSINAVQVASKLRKQGVKLDAADVMQYQSPAALAAFINSRRDHVDLNAEAGIDFDSFDHEHRESILKAHSVEEHAIESIRPCTPTQCGMLAQFLQSEGRYYFNHSTYEVPPTHTIHSIKAAWEAVQQKHQVLRMGFCQVEDAKHPFAMLIYKGDSVHREIFIRQDGLEEGESAASITQSVLEDLHLPAWRITFFDAGKQSIMRLSLHHALYDANSLRTLLADFAKALESHELGPSVGVDSVLKTQLNGASQRRSESETFWKEALQSARLVKFPNLTSRTERESAVITKQMSSDIDMQSLNSFCKMKGVTVQAVGQSVWAMLLATYLGEDDVTFGTVFSGMAQYQSVSFPTIATLPVHCNSKKPLTEVVKDMVTYNASAQRHRFTPLTDIQRFAGCPGQALFDTIFVYQKEGSGFEHQFEWNSVSDNLGIDYVASIEMEVSSSGNLQLRLTCDSASIPEAHVSLILRQFDEKLKQVVGRRHESEATDCDLLSILPAKEPTLPSDIILLHQFLERGAESHPNKTALEFIHDLDSPKSRTKWTYEELDHRGNQVAHLIQQHGVKPGSVIAVCMTKCPEAIFAVVGILKAGCAFLAMDPELPLARRSFICEDSKTQLLLVNDGRSDPELQIFVPNIELTELSLMGYPVHQLDISNIGPDATSYCLYTSGTTGTPKGCELTHENAVQAMLAFQRLFAGHWSEASRWLQFASYWFDVSVLEQFWSWSVGITVVGAPRDLILEDLAGFIRAAEITHIDLTPSLARLLKPEDVPSLHNHVFITGGEALKQEIIDAWGPLHTIYNGYGPTEATIGVTMNPHIGPDDKPSNIGPPFDNVGAYVLVPGSDEPVLRGAVGELCVSGKLVGKGYLNRPELTAKAFPYLKRHAERVYRTGDLVRLLADDTVSFIGRQDNQAKLRGQRLEIDEIDAVIKAASANIADVASLVVKTSDGSREMLVSFIMDGQVRNRDLQVARSEQSLNVVAAADQACRDRLPGYMVPTHIIPTTRLPLTVNNKVDSKSLIAFFDSLSTSDLQQLKGSETEKRALRPAERKVAKALSRLLSTSTGDISPTSNIFSLGLSSVSAINFATLLKGCGFNRVSVATIMNHPTLERLANALSDNDGTGKDGQNAVKQAQLSISAFAQRYRSSVAKKLSLSVTGIESLAPCTPLQEGLLVESLKSSNMPYFNHFWYDVSKLETSRLKRALAHLHSLVPILRTSFVDVEDGFAQVIVRKADCPVEVVSNVECDIDSVLHSRLQQWKARSGQNIFAPFGAVIVESRSRTVLALHAHHALYDGISWELMIRRLMDLYEGRSDATDAPSFTDALAYGPLCIIPTAKTFWRERLRGYHYNPLPTLSQAPSTSDIHIQADTSADPSRLETVRRQLGVSHQALLQSAFSIALHRFAPQTLTYGVVLSGRSIDLENAESIIGPMFNTVPFPVDVESADTWRQYLHRCHQGNAKVLQFQHTPLRTIRKLCGRHPSDPMFDVLFVFQQPNDGDLEVSYDMKSIEMPVAAEYPVAFEAEMAPSGAVRVTAAAQAGFISEDDLAKLINTFERVLESIVTNPERRIAEDFAVSTSSGATTPSNDASRDREVLNGVQDFEWTADAKSIQEIIAQVAACDAESVNEHITIFTLGLDSIDAVKLASRLKRAGLSIPVSKILQAQTIPRMLEEIQHQDKSGVPQVNKKLQELEKELQPIRNNLEQTVIENVERILPATPGQEALIADMIRSDFREYYNSDVMCVREGVDISRLKSAWQTVVGASPILRTAFVGVLDPGVDAVYAQIVFKPDTLRFEEITADNITSLQESLKDMRNDVKGTYSQKSPLRLSLATVQGKTYLALSLAHAQYDGQSLALLHDDIAKAYHGTIQARPLYDEAIELALKATNNEAAAFWRDALAGVKIWRFSNVEDTSNPMVHQAERMSAVSTKEARSLCKGVGVSMQALAQTAWALLLAHYLQELEVLFGVVLACRESEEAEQILFPTMNTVPIRASLHGSGQQMLRYLQTTINEVRQYQRTPLRAIQAACFDVVERNGSEVKSGLFDTLFIYQSRGDTIHNQEEHLYKSVAGEASVEYPVAVEFEAVGDDLIIRASCKDHALDKRGVEGLLKRFDHVLDHLVNSPERATVDFSNDRVSICGLPAFPLRTESLSRQATRGSVTGVESDEESPVDSALIQPIRYALAQVSRLPEEEITSNTALESIGIDSISAIKVVGLLREHSVKLSVSDLLKAQTPTRMAEMVDKKSGTSPSNHVSTKDAIAAVLKNVDVDHACAVAGLDKENVETVLPAAAGQQYMLSLWQKSRGELFCPAFSYHLKTTRSADDFRRAWESLVEENPILRTVVCQSGHSDVPLLQIVLKAAPASVFEDEQPHSMAQPLARLEVKKAVNGFDFKLKIQHALYDAVSLPILVQQLQDILNDIELEIPDLRLADYVAQSHTQKAGQSRKSFWTSYLRDVQPVQLTQPPGTASRKTQLFQPDLFASGIDLEKAARKVGLTLQALLFAIYARSYASRAASSTSSSDVVLGIYVANRSYLPDLDRLAAPTLNLLPLLVRAPQSNSVLANARQIDKDLRKIGSIENATASLAQIYEWTGVKVDTFVNFLKVPGQEQPSSSESKEGRAVIAQSGKEWDQEVKRGTEIDISEDFQMPPGLEGFEAGEAYLHAVDVELSVPQEGGLSVGVFGLEEMLSLEDGERIARDFRRELGRFLEE